VRRTDGHSSHKDIFKDYYLNNKGVLFRTFEININNFRRRYDIYWGDPNVILDAKALEEDFPLAVTTIPHRYHYPNPRIFLHERLDNRHSAVFELVIAHEIGHLWLHDVIGFNNPSTDYVMKENESEMWADYFSYSYLVKHRRISNFEGFAKILNEVSSLQREIYGLGPKRHMEILSDRKVDDLERRMEEIEMNMKKETQR